MQPSAWFLLGTLLLTGVATAMLCGAIMTDHWEHLSWDRERLEVVAARRRNASSGRAAGGGGGGGAGGGGSAGASDSRAAAVAAAAAKPTGEPSPKAVLEWVLDGVVARVNLDPRPSELSPPAIFLVPMHGGIWTLCISLTDPCCSDP